MSRQEWLKWLTYEKRMSSWRAVWKREEYKAAIKALGSGAQAWNKKGKGGIYPVGCNVPSAKADGFVPATTLRFRLVATTPLAALQAARAAMFRAAL